jgi:hypothetical protein
VFSAGHGFILIGNVADACGDQGIGLGPDTEAFTVIGNRSVNHTEEDIDVDPGAASRHFLAGNTTDDGPFDQSTITNELEVNGTLNHDGERVGFYGAAPVGKAADPGTATGTDADVINNIVTALRNLGLLS